MFAPLSRPSSSSSIRKVKCGSGRFGYASPSLTPSLRSSRRESSSARLRRALAARFARPCPARGSPSAPSLKNFRIFAQVAGWTQVQFWPNVNSVKGTIGAAPQVYPDPTWTWRVVGTKAQLPLGELVLASVPGGRMGSRGSRYIQVEGYSEEFIDHRTGKEMVVVCGPRKPNQGYVRVKDERSLTEAHLHSTRGLCESCGRRARVVETEDGLACRPCARAS